jgi:hypothetical protein
MDREVIMSRIIFIFLMILFILFSSNVMADDQLILNISEEGKVTSYYDQYWVVNVQGKVVVTNPFNNSFDYIRINFDLGTLTAIESNETNYLTPSGIYIPFIAARESVEFEYVIRGISAYDPMKNDWTVMRSAISSQTKLFSFLISNIRKSEIENETIDTSQIKSYENRRLVIVSIINPTDLYQNITSIKVIKTLTQDPNNELRTWYFPEGPDQIIISPRSEWTKEIIDYNSSDGEVYWLSTDALTDTKPLFIDDQIIVRFTQDDLYNVENGSLSEKETLENITKYLEHLMYLKKSVSDTLLIPGDSVNVEIKVNNFAPINRDITVKEKIPSGFEVVDEGYANLTGTNELIWDSKVNPDTSKLIRYELKYIDNVSLGLDYFDATELKYENETLYSQRIPFIRQYIPEKKIFIQKKLRYSVEDEIVVQIQMQNMGESDIKDIYVKEFLGANDVFREISVAPESKGRWKIPLLEKGTIWEVTYVTNENDAVNLLPEVYGVDKKIVLKTLVFENVVHNEWLISPIKFIEFFAPLFIIGFIIFYFIYIRRVHTTKVRGLRHLGKEIRKLKKSTDLKPRDSISILKRESRIRKDIKSPGGYDLGKGKDYRHRSAKEMAKDNLDNLQEIDKDTSRKE